MDTNKLCRKLPPLSLDTEIMRTFIIGLFTCGLLFAGLTPSFAKIGSQYHTDKFAGSIVAGGGYTGVLNSDGTVQMWGNNASGQLGNGTVISSPVPVAVSELTGVVALVSGNSHIVALKADGTVVAWGNNIYGQLGDGTTTNRLSPVAVPGLTGVVALAAGHSHTLALKADGTVSAWGRNNSGQLGNGTKLSSPNPMAVAGLTGVVALAAGNFHSAALKVDGTVLAWGNNFRGQLGNGMTLSSPVPLAIDGLNEIVAVASGSFHLAALKADGTVMAWGYNSSGQLGDGSTTSSLFPVEVSDLNGVVALAAGSSHTVALKANGTAVAWGDNIYGQLGNGIATLSTRPVVVTGLNGATVLAAGKDHSVALNADGTVRTWGNNASGQLGNGSTTSSSIAVAVPGLPIGSAAKAIEKVVAGTYHTVALKGDGTVVAWGDNQYGQLGDGSTTDRLSPVAVEGLTDVVAVAVGVYFTVALKADGSVMAWGRNNEGQLGDETITDHLIPVTVPGLSGVVAVATGDSHVVALKADGTVVTWGWNGSGQLGSGSIISSKIPLEVAGLTDVVAVAAGYSHTVVLKSDGKVMAWGLNKFGQLGDGTMTNRLTPVAVLNLSGVVAVSAGYDHTVAVITNGTAAAWGKNTSGQLGDGTVTNRLTSVKVSNLSGVVAVSAGDDHTVAVKANGTVAAWGNNDFGQLGDGTLVGRLTPAAVPGLVGITAASAGQLYTVGLKADGTVTAWGKNDFGQLGDATKAQRNSPVGVLGFGATHPVLFYSVEARYGTSGVSPVVGIASTIPVYKVVYTHLDSTPPGSVQVCIDNDLPPCRAMSVDSTAAAELRDNNYANGEQYAYTSPPLLLGDHRYYFTATVASVNMRFPASVSDIAPRIVASYIDLVMASVSKGVSSVGNGASFVISSEEKNDGTIDTTGAGNTVGFYLSLDDKITPADTPIGSRVVAGLAAGNSDSASTSVTVPPTMEPGKYYVGACADVIRAQAESNENNNCSLASGDTVGAATITVIRAVDLVIASVSKSVTIVPWEGSFEIFSRETNQGTTSMSAAANAVAFYLSADSRITTGDLQIGSKSVSRLAAKASSTAEAALAVVPENVRPGVYYVGACADADSVQIETIETNNCKAALGTIKVVLDVDLVMSVLSKTAMKVGTGRSFDISNNEKNVGVNAMTASSNMVKFYLSVDNIITTADILLAGNRVVPNLTAGESAGLLATTVTVPATVPARDYYVGACADATRVQAETREGNNCRLVFGATPAAQRIQVIRDVDLAISAVSTLTSFVPIGSSFMLSNTIMNQGIAEMLQSNSAKFYLSTDALITTGDIMLDGERAVPALAGNASSTVSTQLTVPLTTPAGTYYVGVIVDGENQQVETNEGNNSSSPSAVTIIVN